MSTGTSYGFSTFHFKSSQRIGQEEVGKKKGKEKKGKSYIPRRLRRLDAGWCKRNVLFRRGADMKAVLSVHVCTIL